MLSLIITSFNHHDTIQLCNLLEDMLKAANLPYVCSKTAHGCDRGDSTIVHMIIGRDSGSPYLERRSADILISADPLATRKAIDFLKPQGYIVTEEQGYLSKRALMLGYEYPDVSDIFTSLEIFTPNIFAIPARALSNASKTEIDSHTILLGNALTLGILPLYWSHLQDNFVEIGDKFTKITGISTSHELSFEIM